MSHPIDLWVVGCCISCLVFMSCVHTECISKQPPTCYVAGYDSQANNSYNREQLTRAIVHATGNLTVYESNTAVFRFEVNRSVIVDVTPVVYVDGCKYAFTGNTKGNTCKKIKETMIKCRYNVTMADNGKKLVFYAHSPSVLKEAQICYQPFSYLTVLDPLPSPVIIEHNIICGYLSLQFKPIPPGTHMKCSLYITNTTTLPYYSEECSNDTVLPLEEVEKNYTVSVQTVRTAAKGAIVNITIFYDMPVDVVHATVDVMDGIFTARLTLKVNKYCQTLFVSSNCSSYTQAVLYSIIPYGSDELLTVNHVLLPSRQKCMFNITYDGKSITYNTNISTYHMQNLTVTEVHVYTNDSAGSLLVIKCSLAQYLLSNGCVVEINNKHTMHDNYTNIVSASINVFNSYATIRVYDLFHDYKTDYNGSSPIQSNVTNSTSDGVTRKDCNDIIYSCEGVIGALVIIIMVMILIIIDLSQRLVTKQPLHRYIKENISKLFMTMVHRCYPSSQRSGKGPINMASIELKNNFGCNISSEKRNETQSSTEGNQPQ